MENRTVFFFLLLNIPIFQKIESKKHSSQFSDKSDEKMAFEKTYWLKLEFYNTDRKMKNIITCVFISISMHPNFVHFRQKISFKSTLVSFFFT